MHSDCSVLSLTDPGCLATTVQWHVKYFSLANHYHLCTFVTYLSLARGDVDL